MSTSCIIADLREQTAYSQGTFQVHSIWPKQPKLSMKYTLHAHSSRYY